MPKKVQRRSNASRPSASPSVAAPAPPSETGDIRPPLPLRHKRRSAARRRWRQLRTYVTTHAIRIVAALVATVVVCSVAATWRAAYVRAAVRRPFDAPRVVLRNASSDPVDDPRFWGSYRPGVYFGLKTRTAQSPVVGMMWSCAFCEPTPPLRHWCEQGDRLDHYGWMMHDGVTFGLHEAVDKTFSVSSSFVKRAGGSHGGDWTANIEVKQKANEPNTVVSLFFYVALDGQGRLVAHSDGSRLHRVTGSADQLGEFELRLKATHAGEGGGGGTPRYHFLTAAVPAGLDRLKEAVESRMRSYTWQPRSRDRVYRGLPGATAAADAATLLVFQVTAVLPFSLEVVFESGSAAPRRLAPLAGAAYGRRLAAHMDEFRARFARSFPVVARGYAEHLSFATSTLSNLLGGVGYFHGASLVQTGRAAGDRAEESWPAPLYTAVPSRSFFPRGFLWDEGFHLLLIARWDARIALDIVAHWLDLLSERGWLAREQILGAEARAKVPAAFLVQHPDVANPPTLFLALAKLVPSLAASTDPADSAYLVRLYPRLHAWFAWLNRTQAGALPGTYRWRGRDAAAVHELNPKTLASGFDDYPRASHPTADERHVDLRCWLAVAAAVMADVAAAIGAPDRDYRELHRLLADNDRLDALHWSDAAQRYADYGLHTDDVALVRPAPPPRQPNQPPPAPRQTERVVRNPPVFRFVDSTFGYVGLFPFLLKLIEPTSAKLTRVLADLRDPALLWSAFGLRSLARSAPLYERHNTEHDPPYWRGAVWINVNYMALDALQHYAAVDGPQRQHAAAIYVELRRNLVENVAKQFKATGYVWEHYDGKTGKGKGCHPFTGWSALIVSIMAETY